MSALPPNRQKCLARLGRKETVQALRRMGPERRYPMLRSFLQQTRIDLTDERLALVDVCLASRHQKARKALQDDQTASAETTEAPSQLWQTSGDLVLEDTVTDAQLRQALSQHIPRSNLHMAVKEAHALRRPNRSFAVLDDHDSSVRQCAPQFLDTLSCASPEEADTLLEAIEVFRALHTTKRRQLPEDVPVDVVPDNWQRCVAPEGHPERRA